MLTMDLQEKKNIKKIGDYLMTMVNYILYLQVYTLRAGVMIIGAQYKNCWAYTKRSMCNMSVRFIYYYDSQLRACIGQSVT